MPALIVEKLLTSVVNKTVKCGYKIGNIDITVIAQLPKLSPYIESMRFNIATDCEIELGAVNIKSNNTERMGLAGREEGIEAHAVVLLIPATSSRELTL